MAEGRVAVVTGGLAGIGLSCARALAESGMRVAVGARRGGDDAAREALRGIEGARAYPLDLREAGSVAAFFEAVERDLGPVDVLVNAAGVTIHQTIEGHDLGDWNDVIATNLTGCFLTIRACLPGMRARGWGRIVNIASTAARAAVADHPAYCASKAGLVGLTRAAALEGAPDGVSCVAVSPTWVETEMLRQSAETMARAAGHDVEQEIAALARANPQNRLVQPEEVAALVAFLCSDAAPALTMEDIQINAGAHW